MSFQPVHDAFDQYLAEDPGFSAQLCVMLRGEVVVDLAGGSLEPKSITGVYSVSKAASALVLATLLDEGSLGLDWPVTKLWPEFGAAGKAGVTIRQVLTHQAGLPVIQPSIPLADALESAAAAAQLAAQAPLWIPGSAFGYHALTIGVLMEELVRRATGRTLQELYEERIRGPRDADFYLGLPESLDVRYVPVGDPVLTAAQEAEAASGPPVDALAESVFNNTDSPDDRTVAGTSTNNPAVRRAGPAAIGGVGSARGLAEVFAGALPEASHPIARVETFRAMATQHSWGQDRVLNVTNCFGVVFMLPSPRMPFASVGAFGHDGAGGALAFADPTTGLSFGYIPVPMQYPGGADHRAIRLARLAREIVHNE